MTTEREAAHVVRRWMQEPTELDDRSLYRVLEQLPAIPQRRHRWLRPLDWRPFEPGATRSAGPDGGRIHWRYPNMINATRMVAVIAIIVLGGLLGLNVSQDERASAPIASGNAAGSIWLERDAGGAPTYYVFHGDGIATGFNSELGIGVGEWRPLGDRSLVAELAFTGTDASYIYLEPGTAELRFAGEIDDAGESMDLTYDENTLGITTSTAARKKLAPMPPEAETVTPPDAGWQPRIGIESHGADESGVTIEDYDGRPNQNLEHSDGTWVSINSWVGPGVGLFTQPDEHHGIMTAWFTNSDPDDLPLVAEITTDPETGEISNRYGDSTAFTDSAPGEPQAAPDRSGVDPEWWPSLGSLWVTEHGDGPAATTAMHADGTLLTIDPYRGVGVGSWTPTGADTASVVIEYYDSEPKLDLVKRGRTILYGHLAMDEQHEQASIDFTVESIHWVTGEASEGETGSATMKRIHLAG